MSNTWLTRIPAPDQMMAEIHKRRALQEAGTMVPWTIRRNDTGDICGMTTFDLVGQERTADSRQH